MTRRRRWLTLAALVLVAAPAAAAATEPDPVGVWPLSPLPEVVRGFDPPDEVWGAGHRGVDLAGAPGQRVRTALAGTVRYAAALAGRGVVVIDHGATRTTYEPVSAAVTVGRVLAAGAPIGTLETGASHCAPRACLHWGWLRGETYLDPLGLVGALPVRLLPLAGAPASTASGRAPPPRRPTTAATPRTLVRWMAAMPGPGQPLLVGASTACSWPAA